MKTDKQEIRELIESIGVSKILFLMSDILREKKIEVAHDKREWKYLEYQRMQIENFAMNFREEE